MENETENLDSLNETEELTDEEKENDQPTAVEQKEESEKNKQLFERAKKAETELKELRTKVKELSGQKTAEVQKSQSNEPDYGRLAYLNSLGINHSDDQKIIMDEAKRLNLPLSDVQQMEHIQVRLKVSRESREAAQGIPRGSNRSGGTTPNEIDYWVNREGLPDNQELAEKVVDARMKRESQNKFSDAMYVG